MEEKIIELAGIVAIWLTKVSFVVVSAWGVFQFLGKKWIENKFQKSLQDHKHKHDEEIQRLKCEIDLQLSRVTKIHEKEFEVLPQAWVKLHTFLDLVCQFIRETHIIPELNEMSGPQLEDFLSKSDLENPAKQNIRSNGKKNRKSWYFDAKSKKAGDACLDFQDYITKNGIFLSSDIKTKFKEAEYTIRTAWATRNATEQSQDSCQGITDACKIVKKDIPPIMEEIEKLVQKRLCFHEA